MGPKSLGEQMGVDENDAACYIESFKSRYTGTLHLIIFSSIIQFMNNNPDQTCFYESCTSTQLVKFSLIRLLCYMKAEIISVVSDTCEGPVMTLVESQF